MSDPREETSPGDVSFEKSRYDHCKMIYEMEKSRKDDIEKKAQFYFSMVVIFVGVLSFKGGAITVVGGALFKPDMNGWLLFLISVEVVAFVGSLLLSVLSVAKALMPSPYPKPYPQRFAQDAFGPSSDTQESKMVRDNALRFALAAEICRGSNAVKSQWLIRTHRGILVTVATFVVLLLTVIFVSAF
ncbi:MAG: hypothetical protein GY847_09745 [Proteobacteria bacterium]|nr:hypothetical protein [Pseudomonadota bacterium]